MLKLPHDDEDARPIAAAFSRLSDTQDFKTIKAYLEASLSVMDKNLRTAEGNQLLRSQGAAINLQSLLKLFEESAARLIKIQKSRK